MQLSRYQTTLKGPCTVTGRGYWSGEVNTLTFLPAPPDSGIRFFRRDRLNERSVLAVSENCHGLSLRTCLGEGAMRFEMVEHVMAALAGMQIDNAAVWCTASEMPGMDGSCFAFTSALASVGQVVLPRPRRAFRVRRTLQVGDNNQWVRIEPSDVTTFEYRLDYGADNPIGASTYCVQLDVNTFCNEVSPARTFVTRQEADALRAKGLASHVTERDLLVFDSQGPVDNSLRFSDECARHKVLDLIGDLAVVGVDLVGKITACRSGHQLNAQLARQLREIVLQEAEPHRYEFQRAA